MRLRICAFFLRKSSTWGIISTRRPCNHSQRKNTICCIQLQTTADLGQPSSSRNSHTHNQLRNQVLPPRLQTARSSCFSIQGSAKMLKKYCPSGVLRAGQRCATKMYDPVNKQYLGRTVQSWGKSQYYGSQLLVLSSEIAIDTVLTLLFTFPAFQHALLLSTLLFTPLWLDFLPHI